MSDHKTEIRKREYEEKYCAEESCEFFGKHYQQGVCHTAEPDVADWERIEKHASGLAEELIKVRRENYPADADYIPWLEAHYECAMVNWAFTLDDCIRLRRENARLKLQLENKVV